MDPRIDNPVKTRARRVVSFEVNITNYGNVPDTLHNHTSNRDGDDVLWNISPAWAPCSWSVEWMQVEQIGADLFTTVPCESSRAPPAPSRRPLRLPRGHEHLAHAGDGRVHDHRHGRCREHRHRRDPPTRDIGLKVTSLHGDEAGGDPTTAQSGPEKTSTRTNSLYAPTACPT